MSAVTLSKCSRWLGSKRPGVSPGMWQGLCRGTRGSVTVPLHVHLEGHGVGTCFSPQEAGTMQGGGWLSHARGLHVATGRL